MKKNPDDFYITVLDRLTRFEPAYSRYKRVYRDIISRFLPNIKTKELSIDDEISFVYNVFNGGVGEDYISDIMLGLEEKYFKYNPESYQYLSNRFNFPLLLSKIVDYENLPKNVKWLTNITKNSDLKKLRYEKSLLYPIEMILLCEGETERIVLTTILKMFNCDFDKMGILLIAAGGKNQVARKYYSMVEEVKLPIFVLLDADALEVKSLIDSKLRNIDTIYLINSGEFEDLIPKDILLNTINYIHNCEIHCNNDDFIDNLSSVINIENIFKKYGFGEFKKAHFALALKEYIEKFCSKKDFIDSEIVKIAQTIISSYDNQTLNQENERA